MTYRLSRFSTLIVNIAFIVRVDLGFGIPDGLFDEYLRRIGYEIQGKMERTFGRLAERRRALSAIAASLRASILGLTCQSSFSSKICLVDPRRIFFTASSFLASIFASAFQPTFSSKIYQKYNQIVRDMRKRKYHGFDTLIFDFGRT